MYSVQYMYRCIWKLYTCTCMYWVHTSVHVNVLYIECALKNSSHLKKIIPILEMVAGEAHDRSCDSNRKLTFGPNWILSPDGIVSSLEQTG